MTLKINWFSPLPPAHTDIGHYTQRILTELATHFQVTLWTDQTHWDRTIERIVPVRQWSYPFDLKQAAMWSSLNQADLTFYHLGNNWQFHSAIWSISQRHPGIMVLHDRCLQHFFAGLYRDHDAQKTNQYKTHPQYMQSPSCDHSTYLAVMAYYYGKSGRKAAQQLNSGQCTVDELAMDYPLTLHAIEHAMGVLVHTPTLFNELKQYQRWPLCYAPLPYLATPTYSRTVSHTPPYRLIVFGYLGLNRRLTSILTALAELPEKALFHLDVYGQIEQSDQLQSHIERLCLNSLVTMHGFVRETELDAALDRAHLAFNLRYPSMGEASGSQLRIFDHALPSLVTYTGWYATLPESAVAFVRPDAEIEDICTHLRAFLDKPQHFIDMGMAGRQILLHQHQPRTYVQALCDFASRLRHAAFKGLSTSLMQRIAAEIRLFCPPDQLGTQLPRLASELSRLVG